MARPKKSEDSAQKTQGRALVDVPRLGLKCGEMCELPQDEAERLTAAGAFDPKAKE